MRPLLLALALLATAAQAAVPTYPQATAQEVDILKRAIAFRTVRGAGNETPQFAAWLKAQLVAGGFGEGYVKVVPVDDTAYLVARYRGSDPKAKPLVLSGHMDVVEAKRADWERDPFTPVIENGYVYGRGATDMKFGDAMLVATLLQLKREHYVPRRDIVLALSGDEETVMKTSVMIAQELRDGFVALNADGGGGKLDDATGKPVLFFVDGAEKSYADYELTFTNPGGHSSEPRKDNAIYALAHALDRIEAYQFKPELNDITRAELAVAATLQPPAIAAALRAFVKDPGDMAAVKTLAADPAFVGKIATTCVATMLSGGHALNALPQRASANVNCRIFPGHSFEEIQAELARVVDDKGLTIKNVTEGSVPSPPSPLRPDVMAAIKGALAASYPGVPIVPVMATGASDSMYYRGVGVPSYGASPVFMKEADDFSHGLNERTPIANAGPAIPYWRTLVMALAK